MFYWTQLIQLLFSHVQKALSTLRVSRTARIFHQGWPLDACSFRRSSKLFARDTSKCLLTKNWYQDAPRLIHFEVNSHPGHILYKRCILLQPLNQPPHLSCSPRHGISTLHSQAFMSKKTTMPQHLIPTSRYIKLDPIQPRILCIKKMPQKYLHGSQVTNQCQP